MWGLQSPLRSPSPSPPSSSSDDGRSTPSSGSSWSSSSSAAPDSPRPDYPGPDFSKKNSILYVCMNFATKSGDFYRDWFAIDPNGGSCFSGQLEVEGELGKKRTFLLNKPLFEMPSYMPMSATCVAVGSKLYALGGNRPINGDLDPEITCEAYVYDMAAPASVAEWKSIASMQTPRSGPAVVALDGKLYVMGSELGIQNWWPGTWSEVYDLYTDCWSDLRYDAPNDMVRSTRNFTLLPSVECLIIAPKLEDASVTTKVIVTHCVQARQTYIYCPKINSWNKVLMPLDFHYSSIKCVVAVEQVLFMASPDNLYVYDLANYPDFPAIVETTITSYKCPVVWPQAKMIKGLEEDYPLLTDRERFFFHLGNMDFCLVWTTINQNNGSVGTIHCLRFCVDTDEWHASVLSHDLYEVADELGLACFEQCVQVMYVHS